jgi:Zn finger protein HypA/HybF involved in hydrogenase expression
MDEFMLDGNAVAGLLHAVFGTEMTEANGTCSSCGASAQVGAVHVFRSAGVVLRCPRCDSVLAKIVQQEMRVCVDLRGLRALA